MKPSYEYLLLTNGELEKENLQKSKIISELLLELGSIYTVNKRQKDDNRKLRTH